MVPWVAGFHGAVLDGRDIGTNVCPGARVKLYVTASAETRAQRRFNELQAKGFTLTYQQVLQVSGCSIKSCSERL